MADYVWRENLACVATYKILEGDKFLDEFEDAFQVVVHIGI